MSHPAAAPGARRAGPVGLLIVGAIALLGVLLVVNGAQLLVRRQTGERVKATVTDCVESGTTRARRTDCVGTWTVDGSVRRGKVQGATSDQVGKAVDVTVEGDTAYTRHIALPLMFVGLGLLPLALGIVLLRGLLTARPVPPPGGAADGPGR